MVESKWFRNKVTGAEFHVSIPDTLDRLENDHEFEEIDDPTEEVEKPFDKKNVEELTAFAAENGIDLHGKTTKKDILVVIKEALGKEV